MKCRNVIEKLARKMDQIWGEVQRRNDYKNFFSKLKAVRLSDGKAVWANDHLKIGREHFWTPVTRLLRMPYSA